MTDPRWLISVKWNSFFCLSQEISKVVSQSFYEKKLSSDVKDLNIYAKNLYEV